MRIHLKSLICFVLLQALSCSQSLQYNTATLNESFTDKDIYEEVLRRAGEVQSTSDTIIHPKNERLLKYSTDTLIAFLKSERPSVIYGTDDRYNVNDAIISPSIRKDAEKVACLIRRNQLTRNDDGSFQLVNNISYGQANNLCDGERFFTEPVVPFCSGFAISDKMFATAGHCVLNQQDLLDMLIVYGFQVKSDGQPNLKIQSGDIYEPLAIVGREYIENNKQSNDYCIITVGGKFSPNRIANLRRSGSITAGEKVHVIGYPKGLPLKVTLNAKVKNTNFSNFFVMNSDTYNGNSGSPVFNTGTGLVEGIFVRGHTDFFPGSGCYSSLLCPENLGNCQGEDVSRNSQFINLLK